MRPLPSFFGVWAPVTLPCIPEFPWGSRLLLGLLTCLCAQVETGSTPSFYCAWWFRPSNDEPPQFKPPGEAPVELPDSPSSCSSARGKDLHDDKDARVSTPRTPRSMGREDRADDGDDDHRGLEEEEDSDDEDDERAAQDADATGQPLKPSQHFSHGALPGPDDMSDIIIPPDDYHMFYPAFSEAFDIAQSAWADNSIRANPMPARTALDKVPLHKQHKMSMVVKDKDLVLRNATVTDTVVPIGKKVVHINCVAHAYMHMDKCAPGCLDNKDALRFCLTWVKRIDEGNKVSILPRSGDTRTHIHSCQAHACLEFAGMRPTTCAHSRGQPMHVTTALLCAAHNMSAHALQPTDVP